MNIKKIISKIKECCAALGAFLITLVLALPLKAVETQLATPPPSVYLDAESSVTVPLPRPNDLTRIFQTRMEIAASTNCCIQVALGTDADGDGNLAPEETDLVLGVDCGAAFWRDERCLSSVPSASSPTQQNGIVVTRSLLVSSAGTPTVQVREQYYFTIPRRMFDRTWNAAKVTTRGAHGVSALPSPFANTSITLILKNTPMIIRIR